ncbi:MAG: VWA domain-containing protein [Hyphomicrobiaceae bacterium]
MTMRSVLALLFWGAFLWVGVYPESVCAQEPQPAQGQPPESGAAPAAANGQRSVLFLIDGSGSMWARFDAPNEKRAKIDVVRDLIKPLVAPGANAARIGLESFGHRRRGDCSDVEVIAPLGSSREDVTGALDKLSPRGKGPIAQAIRTAAEAVGKDRPASVVIVNDGVDNCRQDACAAADEFARQVPGVPIDIISIAVPPASQSALQCIAKATGGEFFDAQDPVALTAAVSEVAQRALGGGALPSATPEVAAPAAPELPQAALRATLALAEGGKPMASAAYWRVIEKDTGKLVAETNAPGIAENVKPGDYIVEAEMEGMKASAPAHVEDHAPTTIALALKAARLAVKSKGAKTKSAQSAPLVTVRDAATGETALIGRLDEIDALVPPAKYIVTISDQQISKDEEVALSEGQETTMAIDMKSGRLSLLAMTQANGAPIQDISFSILEDDPDSPDGRREVRRSRAPNPSFTLPAGTYYVVARSGYAEFRERIALSAGDDLNKSLVLPAATLKLSAQVFGGPAPAGTQFAYRIETLGKDAHEIAHINEPTFEGLFNAGHYRVWAILEHNAASAQQDITIEAGKPANIVVNVEAGEATLRAPSIATAGFDTFWEVRDATGRAIWHGTSGAPTVLLNPGRYSVRLETRESALEAAFDIAAGEKRTIELGGS